ncbi:MAG: DegT/DnrJ/EryC1/StrS family aminotransferase [Vicinamibacterales bacterium]
MSPARLPFIDLTPGEDDAALRAAIDRVLRRGWFVLGPELESFEAAFADASGAAYAIGVASGTDALALTLRALGIGASDEVIVPAITAAYTGLAVLMAGARPVFADVDPERLTIDPASCEARIGARTAAIVPVHLFGQPADLTPLRAVAARHALAIVEDCCQAHLATCEGVPVGTAGIAGAFSFYPTKNLGALGDGGAVVTGDPALAGRLRRLRNGGQTDRYRHVEAGVNSRLDELQAAVLHARLGFLPGWTRRRRAIAARYRAALPPASAVPECDRGHVYHLFPIRSADRDGLQAHLHARGIETLIHYPVTLPRQQAFAACDPAEAPAADRAVRELLSLPLHPRLGDDDVMRVAEAVGEYRQGRALA